MAQALLLQQFVHGCFMTGQYSSQYSIWEVLLVYNELKFSLHRFKYPIQNSLIFLLIWCLKYSFAVLFIRLQKKFTDVHILHLDTFSTFFTLTFYSFLWQHQFSFYSIFVSLSSYLCFSFLRFFFCFSRWFSFLLTLYLFFLLRFFHCSLNF